MEHFSQAVEHHISLIQESQKAFERAKQNFHAQAKGIVDFEKMGIISDATDENIKRAEVYSRAVNRSILQMRSDRLRAISDALMQASNDDKFYSQFVNEERGVRIVIQRVIDSYVEWDENLYSKYEQIELMLFRKRFGNAN
ncbi:MAG TPA: hypothetical protein VFW07_01365 [Parafilimonas sp.]|nr:hypothetical protein [Parafilimonas sp.]